VRIDYPVIQQFVCANFFYTIGAVAETMQDPLVKDCGFLKTGFIKTVCPLEGKWWKVGHIAQVCRLLEGHQKFTEAVTVEPVPAITLPAATGSEGIKNDFMCHITPSLSVRPSVLQNQIDPLLDHRRCTVHVERVVPDNNVMGCKQVSLMGDIDIEIRISFVEIMYGYMVFMVQF